MLEALLGALAIAALMAVGWLRNDQRCLRRDFPCTGPFEGPLEPCLVRFPTEEGRTDCVLGANRDGLYLASTAEAMARRRWWTSSGSTVMRSPVFIPWERLDIGPARFPLRDHVRFRVSSNKAVFFVPRQTAVTLLLRAGRAGPPD